MSDVAVRLARENDRATVTVEGDLDVASVPELRTVAEAALGAEGCTTLVLDLGGLTFIDSSGIGCFVALHNAAGEMGKDVRLDNLPEFAARVLTLGGLASLFHLGDTSPDPAGRHTQVGTGTGPGHSG